LKDTGVSSITVVLENEHVRIRFKDGVLRIQCSIYGVIDGSLDDCARELINNLAFGFDGIAESMHR